MYNPSHKLSREFSTNVLKNQTFLALLVFSYLVIYGVSAQFVLTGIKMVYFLSSLLFALLMIYFLDPEKYKLKAKYKLLKNNYFRFGLIVTYIAFYMVTSVLLFSGLDLLYFISSYVFALLIFFVCDRARSHLEKEMISSTSTVSPFVERNPCFLNTQDLSWLIRELNSSLSTVVGFTELILRKQYSEGEKEYMLRIIYSQALSMSNTINKASAIIPDSPVKPKEIHEVVDLLDDKNFK